jgi:hypothetical protein
VALAEPFRRELRMGFLDIFRRRRRNEEDVHQRSSEDVRPGRPKQPISASVKPWEFDTAGLSGIPWDALRREHGLAEGEKLYAGYYTDRPEAVVIPHHNRGLGGSGGTPVWVDGRQLDRHLWLTEDGQIETREDRLALYDPVIFGDLPDDFDRWELFAGMLNVGHCIYERDPRGEAELGLNILADLVGEEAARRLYLTFAEEVISGLPRDRWCLPEGRIREWLALD